MVGRFCWIVSAADIADRTHLLEKSRDEHQAVAPELGVPVLVRAEEGPTDGEPLVRAARRTISAARGSCGITY